MFTLFNPELAAAGQLLRERYESFSAGGWSAADLGAYQLAQLRATVRYVQRNSDFYQRRLAGVRADELTPASLSRVPFTTKQDMRQAMSGMTSRALSDAWIFYETTGTTGASTPCPRDNTDSLHNNMALTCYYSTIFGQHPDARVIGVSGPTELHAFGDTFGEVCRNLDLTVVKMWPHSPMVGFPRAIELMRTLPVSGLFCTPGMALTLAKKAYAAGLDPARDFSLDVIMCTGELASRSLLDNIGALWGGCAYNALYASQETSVLGAAGADGRLYAVPLLNLYEVIDPDTGAAVPANDDGVRAGELVITSLYQGSKPLVRYRTGDLVRLTPRRAGAALPADSLDVLGRTKDEQIIGGQPITGLDLEDLLLRHARGYLDYQIVIDRPRDSDTDTVTLRLELPAGGREIAAGQIDRACRDRLGVPARVEYCQLGPVTTTGAMVSWKAARIVDLRTGEADTERLEALSIAAGRS
jgi:phenylacetate-CoA ligase